MGSHIDCGQCKEERDCDREKKEQVQRDLFFSYSSDQPKTACRDYEPRSYHGVEGVAA